MSEKSPITLTADGQAPIDEASYADLAEKIMATAFTGNGHGKPFGGLTTSKIRDIYALIMNIYTKINEPGDFETYKNEMQYLRVKMAYEVGRDSAVKEFLEKTHLMETVRHIVMYEQFLLYCRYAESLVAYFKFYGGKDK